MISSRGYLSVSKLSRFSFPSSYSLIMLGMSSFGAADPYSEPVIVRSSNTKGTAEIEICVSFEGIPMTIVLPVFANESKAC